MDNLEYLIDTAVPEKIVVRVPVIPGYTDTAAQMEAKNHLKTMGIRQFDLFTYSITESPV